MLSFKYFPQIFDTDNCRMLLAHYWFVRGYPYG